MKRKIALGLGLSALLLWLGRRKTNQPVSPGVTTAVPKDIAWQTPSEARARIVELAEAEIGSSDSAKYWTKVLASGQSKPPHSWCGAFALWVLRMAGLTDWTYDPNGSWFFQLPATKDPKPGDLAWFEANRHVAIVDAVSTLGTYVHLVDGAGTGRKVSERVIPASDVTTFLSIASLLSKPVASAPKAVAVPAGWKRMAQSDVTPAMGAYAQQALKSAGEPGNLQETTIDGVPVAAWTEWHHDETRGYHKGITLLERA